LNGNKKSFIRIAVPSNDGINIFRGMLGRAKEMLIYEISGTKLRLIERRNNPYANTMQHLKTLDIYELLHDCKIIVASRIGKKGKERLQKRGMRLFFGKGNIQEILSGVIKKVSNNFENPEIEKPL